MTMPTHPAFTPSDWLAVRQLYDAAVALTGPARESLITDTAVTEAVRAEVRSLLKFSFYSDVHEWGPGGFLSEPAAATALIDCVAESDAKARMDERLGAWQLVRRLGPGRMGDVDEAAYGRSVQGVVVQAADELADYLQAIHGQHFQIAERGGAGAEVVQCNAHAQSAHTGD